MLDPGGADVDFVAALDPAGVIGTGWLRASHRALDPERSLPYRPYHPHESAQPLTPGEVVPLDVEIWPTSVVFRPATGSRSPSRAATSSSLARGRGRIRTASR